MKAEMEEKGEKNRNQIHIVLAMSISLTRMHLIPPFSLMALHMHTSSVVQCHSLFQLQTKLVRKNGHYIKTILKKCIFLH